MEEVCSRRTQSSRHQIDSAEENSEIARPTPPLFYLSIMNDGVSPSQPAFDQLLGESCKLWSSYRDAASTTPLLPSDCINLKSLLGRTPSFLGSGLLPDDVHVSLACREEQSTQGQQGLLTSGRSMWRTSRGTCILEHKAMTLDLLLGVPTPLAVQISDCAPLTEWPGIQGISGHDKGNYLTILFLAWAYILSARWAEVLTDSSELQCKTRFTTGVVSPRLGPNQQGDVEIDLGEHVEQDEASWWKAVLTSPGGWEVTADYNGRTFLSPWSVSISATIRIAVAGDLVVPAAQPPSSSQALQYLARFCSHNRLHGQCVTALAGALYIPFLSGKSVSLPVPQPAPRHQSREPVACFAQSHSDVVAEHGKLLTYYMTLSTNVWGMRSLLCSTFFNADIECNLVSAWLNPAFAVIDPLLREENVPVLAKVLANRQPKLGSLWLGAIFMGVAKSTLRDIRTGLTAVNLSMAAWTRTEQSFITSEPGASNGETIRREDECRLLFILGVDGYTRAPVHPWKPFGETRLSDAELSVRQHASCGCHCLEYISWNWTLTNGKELEDPGIDFISDDENNISIQKGEAHAPKQHNNELCSQSLSEISTRGIFGWLRSTGYTANEESIYKHPWIDIEGSDDEDVGDDGSDTSEHSAAPTKLILDWLK
ncbi:hypothetical protein L228DRAFT_250079 [Xylona heveae TC161]|uniref:Uncharacterized protein n=1 Tax=Xylona heveae (strain CBS 132557 / TC161) TaxID=1328760 RepID=A0A165AFK3_XYLHT|nr:hypothetical protein L228DRAFT_250079 [Xylona heveae TC161]KZF20395.1 hypothetical protein L228DRAFT_250079 [Xylona heveae TC161]